MISEKRINSQDEKRISDMQLKAYFSFRYKVSKTLTLTLFILDLTGDWKICYLCFLYFLC